MIEVRQTLLFRDWLQSLKDRRAQERISQRLVRLEAGLFCDVKFFSGIGEVRIDYGPGCRLYFVQKKDVLIILLCGGNKSSQRRDVEIAVKMAKELSDGP